jgi:hypothetical protein
LDLRPEWRRAAAAAFIERPVSDEAVRDKASTPPVSATSYLRFKKDKHFDNRAVLSLLVNRDRPNTGASGAIF